MAAPSVVLVDRSTEPVSIERLSEVARALQMQVDRDFGTVWGVEARVEAAAAGAAPPGAWIVAIAEDPGAQLGVHLDGDGGPHAVVRPGDGWTLAASHVLLEMLADPGGVRFMDGPDVRSGAHAAPVRYLVEVCDPCEVWAYEIEGVEVSDFVTPDYYRVDSPTGAAVDFLRRLRRPLEVPIGGYLSWLDPADGSWHQRRPDGTDATGTAPMDVSWSPRHDRDRAFAEGGGRHDVPAIRRAYRGAARSRMRRRRQSSR
jgi:hypothetical protein